MKIIYIGLQAEMYNERRKPSFEYVNFYLTLKDMPGVAVVEYPFDTILAMGKVAWNASLFELVRREQADAIFAFMYTDEFATETLDRIRKETATKIIGWFADDYWRFFNYSRFLAPHLDLLVTTSHEAFSRYMRMGLTNVHLSQWAANPAAFHPIDVPQDIDVSFVGQYKPARGRLVRELSRSGIRVETFGNGWPNGRIAGAELPKIFSRTKVNLNLNARPSRFEPWALGRIGFVKSRNRVVPDIHIVRNLEAWWHMQVPHIHARPFEILASRGFLISGFAVGMDQYYAKNEEVVYFDGTTGDLIEKVRYYLEQPEDRTRIACAGYERTLREHTYELRFLSVFKQMFGRT